MHPTCFFLPALRFNKPALSTAGTMAHYSLLPTPTAYPSTTAELTAGRGGETGVPHGLGSTAGTARSASDSAGVGDISSVTVPGATSAGVVMVPSTLLDVHGCSASEAVVLLLSWLSAHITAQVAGAGPHAAVLLVATGGVGPAPASTTRGGGGGIITLCSPGPAPEDHCATGGPLAEQYSADSCGGVAARTPSQGTTSQGVSAHAAVLAALAGQLPSMLCCSSGMDLLLPFSSAGRLALGLLCCSPLPTLLPDEIANGGIVLPGDALRTAVAAACSAAGSS